MSNNIRYIAVVFSLISIIASNVWAMGARESAATALEPVIVVPSLQSSVDTALSGAWRVVQILDDATGIVVPVAEDGSAVTMLFSGSGLSIKGGCFPYVLTGVIDEGVYSLTAPHPASADHCHGLNLEERIRFHQSFSHKGYYHIVGDKLYMFNQDGWLRIVLLRNP